jgi:1,4-alpha-glucan branching enzyme
MAEGFINFLLNAHLPFVKHPEKEGILEEIWLFEGISETYLPLLRVFQRLEADNIPFKITISMSPTLVSMLMDSLLQERYVRHMEKLIDLARSEIKRTRSQSELNNLARMYLDIFKRNYDDYEKKYGRNIVEPFIHFQRKGYVELITTSATHAFLPLYQEFPKSVEAQIRNAVGEHERFFHRKARGLWLPECGYYPGLEQYFERYGIDFFFVDAHGIIFADKRPKYGVYAPVVCENGIAAFGRDPESSRIVWSAEEGYPGDISYRDFHRDVGFDLPLDYIRSYILDGDIRIATGIKYFANTDPGMEKAVYNREEADKKVEEHAENFIYRCVKQVARLRDCMDRPPLVVCPFDAELFGHWWFEGLVWLEKVLRKIHSGDNELQLITPVEYLKIFRDNQAATPSFSSWGSKGYAEVWLNGSNDWIYRHLHKAIERMTHLAHVFPSMDGFRKRALNQAARELLLMQSSDWAFIMKTGTTVPYAVERTKEHIHNFNLIYDALFTNNLDLEWLSRIEKKNNIFPNIDYNDFA